MNLFSNTISEISKRLKGKELFKEDIAQIISLEVGSTIKPDEVQIKSGVLFLNISPTLKSIVYIKKQKILKSLKSFRINSIG